MSEPTDEEIRAEAERRWSDGRNPQVEWAAAVCRDVFLLGARWAREQTTPTWDDDAATVCTVHRKFIPCRPCMRRHDDDPAFDMATFWSQDAEAVRVTREWQQTTPTRVGSTTCPVVVPDTRGLAEEFAEPPKHVVEPISDEDVALMREGIDRSRGEQVVEAVARELMAQRGRGGGPKHFDLDAARDVLAAAGWQPAPTVHREPLPEIAHKGPHDTDEAMFSDAARKIERGSDPGGGNVRRALAELIRRELRRSQLPEQPAPSGDADRSQVTHPLTIDQGSVSESAPTISSTAFGAAVVAAATGEDPA